MRNHQLEVLPFVTYSISQQGEGVVAGDWSFRVSFVIHIQRPCCTTIWCSIEAIGQQLHHCVDICTSERKWTPLYTIDVVFNYRVCCLTAY